ncbi:MAG: hypothetical protein ACRBBS_03920 [Thalassovita sp.]
MTNRIAFIMGLIIVALILLDINLNEGVYMIFLIKKFWVLIEYMAFWR